LPDRDRCEQRRRDAAERKSAELLGADPETDREREEDRELRVGAQGLDEPLPDAHASSCCR
jgi:hypothetical protein